MHIESKIFDLQGKRELELRTVVSNTDEPHIRQWCFRRQAVKTLLQS